MRPLLLAGRDQRGSTMVEFALVAPVLILLVMGIMEFGRLFQVWLVVTHAAREGGRYAAVGKSSSEVRTQVIAASPSLDTGLLSITTQNAQGPSGTSVTVQVSYPVTMVTPLIGDLLPQNPYAVQSTVVMRLE